MTIGRDDDSRAWAFYAAAALALGVALRLLRLRDQILGDDEFHAVRTALDWDVPKILISYQIEDYCIPLTAFYRAAMDAGWTFSELWFRAPVLAAGLVTPFLLYGWARTRTDAATSAIFALLLAVAPGLVLYTRIVRSYSWIVLLGAIAAGAWLAADRRCDEGRPRTGPVALYVVSGALAIWFHLAAAPFVATLPFVTAVRALVARDPGLRRRALATVVAAAAGMVVGVALFAIPARESLIALVTMKRTVSGLGPSVLIELLQVQAGTRFSVVTAAFWALVALGARALWGSGQGRLVIFGFALYAGQCLGLFLLSPQLQSVILVNRYMLIALPAILLFAAAGSRRAAELVAQRLGRARLAPVLALLGGIALLASGPFGRPDFWASSFQHHYDWIRVSREPAEFGKDAPTGLLQALAGMPPGPIVEYPWHPFWGFNRSFYAYQRDHGRRVIVSNDEPFVRDRRTVWRNYVAPLRATLLASDARLLVVHVDLPTEEQQMVEFFRDPGRISTTDRPYQLMRSLAARRLPQLRAELGEPTYRESGIWMWDLEPLRRRALGR